MRNTLLKKGLQGYCYIFYINASTALLNHDPETDKEHNRGIPYFHNTL